jgi:hypothetical protein
MPKLNSDTRGYRQAIIEEVKSLPEELLPKVYELIKLINDKRFKVSRIVQQAHKITQERKDWTRQQHIDELLKVAKRIRQEAISKGVAIDKESEAAIES